MHNSWHSNKPHCVNRSSAVTNLCNQGVYRLYTVFVGLQYIQTVHVLPQTNSSHMNITGLSIGTNIHILLGSILFGSFIIALTSKELFMSWFNKTL